MSIGERRYRVTFQRAVITHDDYGEADHKWEDLCTSWALVQPVKGAERFAADQVQARVDHRIITRYRPVLDDLNAGDRATWKNRVFDIEYVTWRDHTRKEFEVMVREHGEPAA